MKKKKGSWLVKESKIVYKNPWIEVKEDSVVRPDGKDGIYAILDILPGVTVLAVDFDKTVYLTRNYQYAVDEELIVTSAGGAIDNGETPEQAARRELEEETGLKAEKWTSLGMIHSITSGIISSPNYLFMAENITQGQQNLEGTETIKLFKISLAEAVEQVMTGQITHSASALVILKAEKILLK